MHLRIYNKLYSINCPDKFIRYFITKGVKKKFYEAQPYCENTYPNGIFGLYETPDQIAAVNEVFRNSGMHLKYLY